MDQNDNAIIVELKLLARIMEKGLDELRKDVRDGFKTHQERIDKLEAKADRTEGALAIVRVLVGASFLGAIFSIVMSRI